MGHVVIFFNKFKQYKRIAFGFVLVDLFTFVLIASLLAELIMTEVLSGSIPETFEHKHQPNPLNCRDEK